MAKRDIILAVILVAAVFIVQTAAAQSYVIQETGQTTAYDEYGNVVAVSQGETYYGQDAHYEGVSQSFQDNGDGTVTDNVTGLMWQQTPPSDGYGKEDAATYCENLELAGHDDWRLPTLKELFAIGNYSEGWPYLDETYFDIAGETVSKDEQFWAQEDYVGVSAESGSNGAFGVNHGTGHIKVYPSGVGPGGGKRVRAVRGTITAVNDYADNADGTITDNATGLMWSQADNGEGLMWVDALAYAEDSELAGYDDWRLPNIKELQSIVDYSYSPTATDPDAVGPAIDPIFDCSLITNEAGNDDYPYFWSSTSALFQAGGDFYYAWYVAFGMAVNGAGEDYHGAGAVRFDTKALDGPAGEDAERYYNYVRLVRDADTQTTGLAIPAAARVEGSGAFFSSRLEIFNASEDEIGFDVLYTPRTDVDGSQLVVSVSLAGNQMVTVDDVLGTLFDIGDGEDAVGSLLFAVTEGSVTDLMISSVITAAGDDGSEYGQAFPATAEEDALQPGETAYLNTTVDAENTRVNFGAMAWADDTVIEVQPVDPADTPLGNAVMTTLDFGESFQLNDVASSFTLGDIEDYLLSATVTSGSAVVYASVLDGNSTNPGTSDPTTIRPVTAGAETVTLLELGPVDGYDEFSGSASITNLSDIAAQLELDFYERGEPGVAATVSLDIPIGDTLGWDDIVGELFGLTDVGTVVIRSLNGTEIMATGREFSLLVDDEGESIGTAGQLIPGMTDDDLVQPGTIHHLLGLQQLSTEDGRERSHIAAFNPGDETVELEVTLVDGATGDSEGETTLTVEAGELIQTNNIIEVINPDQDGAPKRLEVTTNGEVFIKAFRVNTTGDPVTIDALAGKAARNAINANSAR